MGCQVHIGLPREVKIKRWGDGESFNFRLQIANFTLKCGRLRQAGSAECEKIESHAEIMEKSGDEVLDLTDIAKMSLVYKLHYKCSPQ